MAEPFGSIWRTYCTTGSLLVKDWNKERIRPCSISIPRIIQKQVKAVGDRGKIGIKDERRESPDLLSSSRNTGDLPIPLSYYYDAASGGDVMEAFLEYVLQAETIMIENVVKNEVALGITAIPLVIGMLKAEALEMVARPVASRFPCQIVAHWTDTNFNKSNLRFRQKMKKIFCSASFPKFSFDVRVGVPTSIQQDDPTPLSF